MHKIINFNDTAEISEELKKSNKKIVLVGGCFDVLHNGHLYFLNEAKKLGNYLFLLLESDDNIQKRKGKNRPFNTQKNRSIVLSSIKAVDYIINLKGMTKDEFYDKLIVQIKPDVIALTEGDEYILQRQKQCELVNAQLKIIKKIDGYSTSNLALNRHNYEY